MALNTTVEEPPSISVTTSDEISEASGNSDSNADRNAFANNDEAVSSSPNPERTSAIPRPTEKSSPPAETLTVTTSIPVKSDGTSNLNS